MPKRKRRPAEEIPEELPEEEAPLEEEIPRVGLRPTPGPAEDKEAKWANIEAEMTRAKDDYLAGTITLDEAIDRLVASLNAQREAPGLGGLGAGPEMAFPPAGPAVPPGPVVPPEEISPIV